MPLPLKFLINYRRDDHPEMIEEIREELAFRYDTENVFMDLDIPNFSRFVDELQDHVKASNVLLAFIGPRWLQLLKARAIQDEPDILVMEIKQALSQEYTIVATICFGGADIPTKTDLPAEIREMLEFQIPHFQFGSEFLTDVRKVCSDIETEYTKRGLRIDRTQELESILRLPGQELEEYVFGLLEARNVLRLEKHLRDFPAFLLDSVYESEATCDDNVKKLIAGIAVFGVVFVKFEEYELYRKYLRSQQRLLDDVHRRLSDSRRLTSKMHILSEILRNLYVLGATLVREDKLQWLSDCFGHSVAWENGPCETSSWIRYLQHEGLAYTNESDKLLHQICTDIMESSEDAYFFNQFSKAEDSLKTCICQFDFLHCLHISFCADDKVNFSAFPFFGVYYLDRTAPAMERLIQDTNLRKELFGEQSCDGALSEAIVRYCTYARSRHSPWGVRWNFSRPQAIVSFVDKHAPEYLTSNPNYRL